MQRRSVFRTILCSAGYAGIRHASCAVRRFVHLKMALFARANANASLLTNNCYLLKLTSRDVKLRGLSGYTRKFSTGKRVWRCSCLGRSLVRANITSNTGQYFVRQCHVVPHNANYLPFDELINKRRSEANRSILVQVQSLNSYGDLYNYCKQFGQVTEMYHYTIRDNLNFYLIEFMEAESANAALEAATHINYNEVIPVQSPMLWFRNLRVGPKVNTAKSVASSSVPAKINCLNVPSSEEVTKRLMAAKSISEQMNLIHDAWKLNEVGIRLRFLTAHQLERSFVGLFPHIAVFPFGSSVNGFGREGCDLDLVLSLDRSNLENVSSRFVFQSKGISNDTKNQSKKLLESIADSMHHFVPGISNVRRILMARVPIIKYDHTFTGLECDLSMTNMAAVYMSELLCLYGEIDPRVRPLVFTIRQWATKIGLTNRYPGRWITNFSLTLLVLFYLQQRQILPSLKHLKSLAGKNDIRLADQSQDCTFLRDVRKLPKFKNNTESLETLLHGFFEFYSTFDFSAKAISLREGIAMFKPDYSPLYICNPLESMLNVSKNVSNEETERFTTALRNASWQMETVEHQKLEKNGILSIFENNDIVSYVDGKRVVNFAAIFKTPYKNEINPTVQHPKTKVVESTPEFRKATASTNLKVKKQRWR